MSDEADQAQTYEQRDRDHGLARALAPPSEPPRRSSAGTCETCRDPIEPERLAVQPAARRCFCCQESRERLRKLFKG